MRFLVLALVTLPFLTGCKGPCRELSEQLCGCETGTVLRQQCEQRAQDLESRVDPTAEQEATCQRLLDEGKCDCNQVDTEEGKKACGLAR